jgi:hypothetical protein
MPGSFSNPKALKTWGIMLMVGGFFLPGLVQVLLSSDGTQAGYRGLLVSLELGMIAAGIICYWRGKKQLMSPSERLASRFNMRAFLWQTAGVILMGGSVPLCIAVLVVFLKVKNPDLRQSILLASPIIALGWYCYQRGRKYKTPLAAELLAEDARPPVVYLRSFKDDPIAAESFLFRRIFSFSGLSVALESEEEQLAEAMNELGPFVAIGRPGERLPELGAARMYVSDAEWQNKVGELLARAQLVVLRAGETPGFWWEMQRVIKTIAPERVIVLLPFGRRKYEIFRENVGKYLPSPLPDAGSAGYGTFAAIMDSFTGGAGGLGALKALVYFDHDWTPHLTVLEKLRKVRVTRGKKLLAHLKAALDPAIQRLGVQWRKPV